MIDRSFFQAHGLIFVNKHFKKLAYIINASCEGNCIGFERKKHHIGFLTFKLPASTKNHFMTDQLNIIFEALIFDY